jgi:guanylate kinase
VVAGPSGVGKSTLVRTARKLLPALVYSRSYTSRPPRPGERASNLYRFIARAEFQELIEAKALLEWASFNGNLYGTAKREVRELLHAGHPVIKEIEVQGVRQLQAKRRAIGGRLISIFILPPSLPELERRLRGRGTEGLSIQQARLRTARRELRALGLFDYLIINREPQQAARELARVIALEAALPSSYFSC